MNKYPISKRLQLNEERLNICLQTIREHGRFGGIHLFWPSLDVSGNPIPEGDVYLALLNYQKIYFD